MGLHPLPCAGFGRFFPRFLVSMLGSLFLLLAHVVLAQSPEVSRRAFSQVDSEFPQVADAIASKDPSALKNAFERLPSNAQQRLLTVLHAQRILPRSSSSGSAGSGSAGVAPGATGLQERPGAGAGGGAIANYSELMSLIESTISPDVWLNAGGTATMSPFRQGVRITTDGVIERISNVKQSGSPETTEIPELVHKGCPRLTSDAAPEERG